MKTGISLLMVLVFFLSASGQEETERPLPFDRKFHHALGFAAGLSSGIGLSYQFYHKHKAIQLVFLPLKDEIRERYNVGLSFKFNLAEGKHASLILLQSNSYFSETIFATTDGNGNTISEESNTSYTSHGISIGIETTQSSPITLFITGGYGAFENFERIGFT